MPVILLNEVVPTCQCDTGSPQRHCEEIDLVEESVDLLRGQDASITVDGDCGCGEEQDGGQGHGGSNHPDEGWNMW